MQPANRDLVMYQGDPYEHVIDFTDDQDNPLVGLSGVWKSDIHETKSNDDPIVSFTIDTTNIANGSLILSLTGEQTAMLPIDCFWDLELVGTGTYLEGKVLVKRQVTR